MIVAGGAHVDPPTTDQKDDPGGNNGALSKSGKRLSGAQKRKLARLRDQERGLPLHPCKKGSRRKGTVDGGGGGAVAPPAPIPEGSWLLAGPSTSGGGGTGGAMYPVLCPISGLQNDALNSTKMAVVHSNHPEERLSDVEANLVYGSIIRAAMDSPAGQGPQFCSGHTSNGVVYITCSNSRSKGWLEERVAELRPWEGASLRLGG
ncbi:hypothetical protein GE061_007169 [Apolygus lucorum]|uniref:DUF4780 domain-containing protein n=1 Tax=Apolygus lucorum TaxID=248454 RepID=A0A8S9WSD0_APOLU|nr:hypothetical protein GE061_007169 [Apolygus lucorum]